MASKGKLGKNSKLQYTVDGNNWVDVVGITKIGGPKLKADVVDVSDMDSPGNWREKIAAMLDAGEVTIDVNWNDQDATHLWLYNNLGVAPTGLRMQFPTANAVTKRVTFGTGSFVSAVGPEVPFDNKMTAQIVVTVSGTALIA